MNSELRRFISKRNLLNALIAQLNDSGLFSPQEIAEQTAPLITQIQEIEQEIRALKETSTPQTSI